MSDNDFLSSVELRPLILEITASLKPVGLALGNGPSALEVAVLESPQQPTHTALKEAWKARHGGRATPVLVVALYQAGNQQKAALCGPQGDDPPVIIDLDIGQIERVCLTALSESDRHSAIRFLHSALENIDTPLAGLHNEGLLSSHQLNIAIRDRRDLEQAKSRGRDLLGSRGEDLIRGLGFEIQQLPGPEKVLIAGTQKIALAIFLQREESPETGNVRFNGMSAVSYALARADEENLPYAIISNGPLIRLHSTKTGVGVGHRGRTETFVSAHLELLRDDQAALLWYLFSADALSPSGSLEQLLEESRRFAISLGERLQSRIYDQVVPQLATALAKARDLSAPTQQDLHETYQMALTILFRLLFVAYAEDKDLLPYKTNESYRLRSLKEKAKELLALAVSKTPFGASYSHWEEIFRLFRAVDKGNVEWGVPEYNGGLFSEDGNVSSIGVSLASVTLPNHDFGPILSDLLLDNTEEGLGPVDFRSLGVRDFGTIYEGLLESELSVADTDLDVDESGSYVPARSSDPKVLEGQIYLHNRSGARKASGSYFTKSFAVEHLLDHSLEPALDDHISRLDGLSEENAGASFFDFRVADIAMGSGHFLVAAVDRLERRLARYLVKRPLAPVADELSRLRNSAVRALGPTSDRVEIEDTQLLRRQIARRCIYGVDLNPLGVQLARLSLWVHTFVPGLPLSLLDHHLVQGNSLVGVATMDELQDIIEVASGGPLFRPFSADLIARAADAMARVGRLADADAAEIVRARQALETAREETLPFASIMDVLTAASLDSEIIVDTRILKRWQDNPGDIHRSDLWQQAMEILAEIPPFHFPLKFSDVLQRTEAGFNVIIGNPPWEEIQPEEHQFWPRYSPGYRGIPQRERERFKQRMRLERPDLVAQFERELQNSRILGSYLAAADIPGFNTGDADVYKAFCWRFWRLLAPGGCLGVVLPRSVWNTKGSEAFRREVFTSGHSIDLTFVLNRDHWVFDDMEPRYTIALTSLKKTTPTTESAVPLRGPYRNLADFRRGVEDSPLRFPVTDVLGWTDSVALPLLPNEESGEVFAQLRRSPRLDLNKLDSWRIRPHRELDATNDKGLMTFTDQPPEGYWPVFKGESFDIWESDRGSESYYAWADPEIIINHLQGKRLRAGRNSHSAFNEFSMEWRGDIDTLPCFHPRIAFRNVTRATDTRSVRAALIPPEVVITNAAPYLLWPRGDETDQAYLLGVLCSLALDWYSRRFVEVNMNFFIFNPFPVPRPSTGDALRQRVIALAGRLSTPDDRFAEWAGAVGVEWGVLQPDEKEDMIHELDAVVAHLYGLSEPQLHHIFETFHEGWDYGPRLEATLAHYQAWSSRL